ncbi:VIT family protein [Aquihabitans daechungensis]|uniref:VIT1/CCC1 transporter family protein n=1 Tax=Aquihabitans daechungensis TaxID=1052257 RepID=UPI003B9FA6A3
MTPDPSAPATAAPELRTPKLGPSFGRSRRPGGRSHHHEEHTGHRGAWLRAGVLGANDGLLSTASILVGVASASADRSMLLATGVAALVAGAGSMAIGEYSSVSSQRDAEQADLAVEAEELRTVPKAELAELTGIYQRRGLEPALARQVAEALSAHDALTAHARDELGIDPDGLSRPMEASIVSAGSFSVGALIPILVVLVSASVRVPAVVISTLIGLGALGAIGARLGGAPPGRPALRVLVGGAAAMALAWGVGQAFNVSVA